jgi:hypothetical protein
MVTLPVDFIGTQAAAIGCAESSDAGNTWIELQVDFAPPRPVEAIDLGFGIHWTVALDPLKWRQRGIGPIALQVRVTPLSPGYIVRLTNECIWTEDYGEYPAKGEQCPSPPSSHRIPPLKRRAASD